MLFALLKWSLLAFGAGAAIENAGHASIQVRSVVEIEGSRPAITLGDLIVPHGVSASSLETLAAVRLADLPSAGESRTFTALGIEEVVRPRLDEIEMQTGEHIALRVPTRVTIVRRNFRLTPETVEASLQAQLRDLCSECSFEISNLQLPKVPPSVSSDAKWQLKLRAEIPKGTFSLPLEITSADQGPRTFWVSGQISVRKKVPVAARSIEIGERLHAEDFNWVEKDVTFSTDVPPSEAEISASVAARQIAAGQIFWRASLRRELALKTGDIVKVTAGDDGWQVMIDGISQSSGYIGDTVKVKIPRTQKMVSGLLTAKGLVEVR